VRRSCPPSTSCSEVDAVAPQVAAPCGSFMARPAKAERCCLCHSPALRPWIAVFGVLRGGELEPGALAASGKLQAKAAGNSAANSACAKRRGAFLS